MLGYFQKLPNRPLPARRRFVVFATAFSFALIVLMWVGVLVVGRRSAPTPAPSLVPAGELPEAPLLLSPTPSEELPPGAASLRESPAPSPKSPVDVGEISTSLIKIFSPLPPAP